MSDLEFNYAEIAAEAKSWPDWAGEITSTRSEINDASTAGFRPEVAASAKAFLSSWVELTTTMRDAVTDVGSALEDTSLTWRSVDDGVSESYSTAKEG